MVLLVPHFDVSDFDGEFVRYQDIWQRSNLLLVCLGGADTAASSRYRDALAGRNDDLTRHETRVVVTGDSIPGLPSPSVVIADRWGEVHHVATSDEALAGLPPPDALIEWLRFVQIRCPECEGEWR